MMTLKPCLKKISQDSFLLPQRFLLPTIPISARTTILPSKTVRISDFRFLRRSSCCRTWFKANLSSCLRCAGPQVIYKEGGTPASTDFITKAIQGYGTTSSSDEKTYENESTQGISSDISSDHEDEVSSFVNKAALEADDDEVPARKTGNYSTGTASVTGAGTNRITDNRNSNASASSTSSGSSTGAGIPTLHLFLSLLSLSGLIRTTRLLPHIRTKRSSFRLIQKQP